MRCEKDAPIYKNSSIVVQTTTEIVLCSSWPGDMAAHTQRAYYIRASDRQVRQDVTDKDRFIDGNPANGETNMTLDRLFSEAPEDSDAIRFHGAGRIAVIQGLFPDHYEHFVSQVDDV
jgi:hypothetical protein